MSRFQLKKNRNKRTNIIHIAVFLILIFGLSIAGLFVPVKAFSYNENRYLAAKPQFSWKSLVSGKYTAEYEEFITDQFVLRDDWIWLKTATERLLLKQDSNSVYFGKDGYLIEKHPEESVDKEQADKNFDRLIEFLNKYNEKLQEGYLKLMLVPTASEILTDKMPPFATNYDQGTFIEKVKEAISNEMLVDIRDTLWNHKDEYIYYKTDHHWTSLGAYYAYQQWAQECGFTPLSLDEFNIILASDQFLGTLHSKVNVPVKPDEIYLYETKKDMDYHVVYDLSKESDSLYELSHLKGKDKYSVYLDGNHGLVEIDTNLENGRKLLVIKDSFSHSFVPFAANHFEKTYMVDLRYFNMSLEQFMEENEITDVLVLYNVMNYVNDKNTSKLLK